MASSTSAPAWIRPVEKVGRRIKRAVKAFRRRWTPVYWANKFGYTQPTGLGYFRPEDVVPKAIESGMSLCDYLESNNIGGVGVRRDMIVQALTDRGVFDNCSRIVEIGAGTGMFLERQIELARPIFYDVFETSPEWASYLREAYQRSPVRLTTHAADGRTLQPLADACACLVLAHGVYVYLPLIVTTSYLNEAVRVLRPDGLMVFDLFLETDLDYALACKWLTDPYGYTFPVVTSRSLVDQFVSSNNLEVVATFTTPYHGITSTYFVLKKPA